MTSDWKHEKFAVGAHVLVSTQNVVISCCCFAEYGKEMYQVLLCTYKAIILLIKVFVLPRSRCRCVFLKVPSNVLYKVTCNHSTSSPDEDLQYAVETSRFK